MRLLTFILVMLCMFNMVNASAETENKTAEKPADNSSSNTLSCIKRSRLYIPIQTLPPNSGRPADSRQAYMDSKYGSGGWRPAEKAGVDIRDSTLTEKTTKPVVVTISTDKPEYNYVKAAIVTETRLDYSDDGLNTGYRYRFRQLAEYALTKNAVVELLIPPSAIKGNGALLVVLSRGEAQAKTVELVTQPVSYDRCIQQIYVKDRRTAIRLNSGK